jgi:hypothetical protein
MWKSKMNASLAILACSGPGAFIAIRQNITIGYFAAAIGAVVVLAIAYDALRTRRLRLTLPSAALMLLIHPAWTISAVHGDCGYSKRDASYFFTAVYLLLLFYQFLVSPRRSPEGSRSDSDSDTPSKDEQGLGYSLGHESVEKFPNPYQAPQSPLGE